MNVVIPFHRGDADQAQRLISAILSFGPYPAHRFFLMTQQGNQRPELLPDGWTWLTDWLDVKADWANLKDASAANAMFTQTAREMCRLNTGPWLWLEPDCAVRRGWLDAISDEYQRGGKPFMGGYAPTDQRMSGVAVYPWNTSRLCHIAMASGKIAFDYAAADEFRKFGVHFTDLICDQFRCDPFKEQSDFNARVPQEAVLHHGDKTGSVQQFMGGGSGATPSGAPASPIHFERVPPNPTDAITPILNQKLAEVAAALPVQAVKMPIQLQPGTEESFSDGMNRRLNWIVGQLDQGDRRQQFYAALKKRGIEAGRKKRALPKKPAKAH